MLVHDRLTDDAEQRRDDGEERNGAETDRTSAGEDREAAAVERQEASRHRAVTASDTTGAAGTAAGDQDPGSSRAVDGPVLPGAL